MSIEEKPPKPAGTSGYETTDADSVSIALAGLLVALGAALAAVVCGGMFHLFTAIKPPASELPSPMMEAPQPPPEPRLQINPVADMRVLREREDAELNGYGWVDRPAGVVRIPIHRAMELLLQRGLPVIGQPEAKPPQKTVLQLQQERPLQYTAPKGEEAK